MRNRLLAGAGVLVAFLIGMSTASETTAAIEDKVELVRAREKSADQAQAEALAREHKYKKTGDYFASKLEEDLATYGLSGVDVETLKQPNAFEHPIDEPKVLAAGASFESKHLRVKAAVEKVSYRRQGATVSANHSVAKVTNQSDVPVAYFIDVRSSDRGECKVRGTRMHNAMSLLPGETAEIAVCAGTGGIEILDLRVLEVTPIGHVYVSRLPPQTVGYDAVSARAHTPGRGIEMCSSVPSVKLATLIRDTRLTWEDVVDFYSRHNCDRVQYLDGYERATEPLPALPVAAAGAEPAPAG
jgi:hypothetical protein